MRLMYFRSLVGVTHTVDEMKAVAAEYEYPDEPDDKGNPRMRPGKLTDKFPSPYPNELAARAANNGALPIDLSLITLARKHRNGGENYVFHLLTSYVDAPGGVKLQAGQAYNPYFEGGTLGMPQQLFDDMLEFDDGTPATVSQMAKDVSAFLAFAADPNMETRKRKGLKIMLWFAVVLPCAYYMYRSSWAPLKLRHIANIARPPSTRLHPHNRILHKPHKDY